MLSETRRYLKDRLFATAIVLFSILAFLPLFHIMGTVILKGSNVVARTGLSFLISTPPSPLSRELGGIAPAVAGSLVVALISTPITVILALLSAILNVEFPGNTLSRIVDVLSRSLASVPTVIVSMVVYSVVVVPMKRFSLIAGAIALTIVSLPYAYTSFASALASVPRTYREASYAIGLSRWRTVIETVIPIARRAFIAGVLLTFARSMGETAALLFTVGRNRFSVNINPLYSGDALSLLIFDFISTPFRNYHEIAWGASFILLMAYIVVFVLVKILVKEVRL